jgi:hypothetical protein
LGAKEFYPRGEADEQHEQGCVKMAFNATLNFLVLKLKA